MQMSGLLPVAEGRSDVHLPSLCSSFPQVVHSQPFESEPFLFGLPGSGGAVMTTRMSEYLY